MTRVGADLAKRIIQVHAVDASGNPVTNRALPRDKFVTWCVSCQPVVWWLWRLSPYTNSPCGLFVTGEGPHGDMWCGLLDISSAPPLDPQAEFGLCTSPSPQPLQALFFGQHHRQ